MLKKHTNLCRFFFILLTLPLFNGCGGRGQEAVDTPLPAVSQTQTADPSLNAEDIAADSPKKVVLIYARGMDETDATVKLIEEYNNQSDTVQIKYQELPYALEEQYNQISLAMESGHSGYDVIDIDLSYNAEFASKGYSLDLTPYVESGDIDWNDYLQSARDATHFNDKPYAMPKSISPGMLYVRTDIIDSAPNDWDQLISLSRQLKGYNGTKHGYVFGGKMSDAFVVEVLECIYSYGGRLMDANGNLAVNLSETVMALEKFKEIYNSDFVPRDIYLKSNDDACVSFLNGESVFMRNLPYAWALGNKSNSAVKGKFAIAPLPKGDAGSVTLISGFATIVSASTAYPDEAWDFVQYMTGHEGQATSAVYGGRIPTRLSVLDDKVVLERNPHFGSSSFRNLLTNALPRPVTPYYSNLMQILRENLDEFLVDRMTAEELLRDFVDKMSVVISNG